MVIPFASVIVRNSVPYSATLMEDAQEHDALRCLRAAGFRRRNVRPPRLANRRGRQRAAAAPPLRGSRDDPGQPGGPRDGTVPVDGASDAGNPQPPPVRGAGRVLARLPART